MKKFGHKLDQDFQLPHMNHIVADEIIDWLNKC